MILDEFIRIKLNLHTSKIYADKGYDVKKEKGSGGRLRFKKNQILRVEFKDLLVTSKFSVRCESCNKERKIDLTILRNRPDYNGDHNTPTICSKCNKTKTGLDHPLYLGQSKTYNRTKRSAKKRKLSFALTYEEFYAIANQNCHYCGIAPEDSHLREDLNGLDRKDSSKGYSVDNCVPCCFPCNNLKHIVPYNMFLDYIKDLYTTCKKLENKVD